MNHKLRNYWGAEMVFLAAFSAVVREIEKYALCTTKNTRVRNHLSKNLENYFLAPGLAYFLVTNVDLGSNGLTRGLAPAL